MPYSMDIVTGAIKLITHIMKYKFCFKALKEVNKVAKHINSVTFFNCISVT